MRKFILTCLLFITTLAFSQGQSTYYNRGSIPEELLRPKRGEAERFPIDTVIGELGQGSASSEAYSFARSIASGFMSGEMGHPNLAKIHSASRESYLSALEAVRPLNYRIGGGREEPDGAISFMVRYIGRDHAITGELFVRYVTTHTEREIRNEAKPAETNIEETEDSALVENVELAEISEATEAIEEEAEIVQEEVKVEVVSASSWEFDDLILEEAKSREAEQREGIQRFDFSPYERFF